MQFKFVGIALNHVCMRVCVLKIVEGCSGLCEGRWRSAVQWLLTSWKVAALGQGRPWDCFKKHTWMSHLIYDFHWNKTQMLCKIFLKIWYKKEKKNLIWKFLHPFGCTLTHDANTDIETVCVVIVLPLSNHEGYVGQVLGSQELRAVNFSFFLMVSHLCFFSHLHTKGWSSS